ncbi:peptidylprolyl isomerase [Actinomadura fulvescens]|uniref:Peptidyl-prolyl cis-trans isomerase n=1 Tax=Actinomadura fulvescens TaxID=46160 RepID=A0ABP6D1C9_9ACTN
MAGKDRKKQLARQRFERQEQARLAREARARRVKIIGSVAAVAVIAGGGGAVAALAGGDDDKKDKSNADAAASPSATPTQVKAKPGECGYTASQDEGAPKDLGTPPVKPVHKGKVEATIKTNLGDIELELDGKKAPCTAGSFAYLASKNFFDKTDCHRVTKGGAVEVLQCGDPTGSGRGGPGYQFANENTKGVKYARGTLAMANAGADTNGSQFFIVHGKFELPPDYSVFGKITKGMDLVDEIVAGGSEPAGDGKPKKKVTIQDVAIAKK